MRWGSSISRGRGGGDGRRGRGVTGYCRESERVREGGGVKRRQESRKNQKEAEKEGGICSFWLHLEGEVGPGLRRGEEERGKGEGSDHPSLHLCCGGQLITRGAPLRKPHNTAQQQFVFR